ncbi:MAG TPA: ChbG/HpnK family deacetylase, partial [Polyangiaceae bacterium]
LFRSRPKLCVGLHVALNAEWESPRWGPVLPPEQVPSLVDENGHFWPTPMHTFERGVDLDQAMREIKAQLDQARDHGLSIRYIDEHMGVGWIHPKESDAVRLGELVQRLAQDEGLLWHGLIPELPSAEALGLASPTAEATARELLLARLDWAKPGAYLMYLHPAHDGDEMRAASFPGGPKGVIAAERAADFALATDGELARALAERGIRSVRYDEA